MLGVCRIEGEDPSRATLGGTTIFVDVASLDTARKLLRFVG